MEYKLDFQDRLTWGERRVVRELCKGHQNKHIARTLGISDKTVRFHLTNVYKKYEVSNRVALIFAVHELQQERRIT